MTRLGADQIWLYVIRHKYVAQKNEISTLIKKKKIG